MSNTDTFDPFDDDLIPLGSASDASDSPIAESDIQFNTLSTQESKAPGDDEELYALIDAQAPTVNKESVDKHAEQMSASVSSKKPFEGVSSYKQITKTIFATLKKLQDLSVTPGNPGESALHTVSVQPYKASKPYQVTGTNNRTYLFAITLNETVRYNLATATFDGEQLVQIEIMRKVFTPDSNLKYPLLAFAHELLAFSNAGGVYLLDGEPIILANGHAAPIYARDLEFEISLLNEQTHIRLQSY